MSIRSVKVANALKKEISLIIHEELKDPRIGFVTITNIDLTDDLRYARVYYSVMDTEEKKASTREGLEHSAGFIKHLVGKRIRLKFIPELKFIEDKSWEEAQRIEGIFKRLKKEKENGNSRSL